MCPTDLLRVIIARALSGDSGGRLFARTVWPRLAVGGSLDLQVLAQLPLLISATLHTLCTSLCVCMHAAASEQILRDYSRQPRFLLRLRSTRHIRSFFRYPKLVAIVPHHPIPLLSQLYHCLGLVLKTLQEHTHHFRSSMPSASSPHSAKRKRDPGPKFYAVQNGHRPGVYHSWQDCLGQVSGYKGATCKKSC